MRITVLGAGAWGTALARLLSHQPSAISYQLSPIRHAVTLWDWFPETLEVIRRTGRNERYLPGIELPSDWTLRQRLGYSFKGRHSNASDNEIQTRQGAYGLVNAHLAFESHGGRWYAELHGRNLGHLLLAVLLTVGSILGGKRR